MLDITEIKKIIPHRYPMLLLDRVNELTPGKEASGIHNVSSGEMFVQASSASSPHFPRPLIIEAMAQVGAVALLAQDEFKGKTAYFGGIRKANFYADTVPGDQLVLKTKLTKIRGPIGMGVGEAYVDDKKIADAELTFMIGQVRKLFKKVLIANRGEIAVRIIRSLKEMGIKTVAIYSTADRDSLHVQLADEAVCVGKPQPNESYLNMKNILAAAVGTGAEAIHPGYGFLSESAEFAQMCAECGLTFIGPSAKTIDQMGNKEHARQTMIDHGVPVTPGSTDFLQDPEEAKQVAEKIGYPVLLKAAAGGGGKGIRQVQSASEMQEKFIAAQTEAKNDFGNGEMYLEKVMQNVKHIEVQIFRDQFGNCVYFPERDCSLQRNKQKVLEESPCDLITEEERKHLGEIAVKAAEAADYLGTGTIEFLMDQDHHFYFMEMNTRIQVEHTVTEMVTGVDLVKAQIQVAAGEKLPFTQSQLKAKGHAIECRINAEDPANNFMPSVGSIDYLYLPIGNPGMRIDSALYQGEKISPYYDSMLAKVVSHGKTRTEAIAKMKRLLSEMVLKGVTTNQEFHLSILNDPGFIKGDFTNTYLEDKFLPEWKEKVDHAVISA